MKRRRMTKTAVALFRKELVTMLDGKKMATKQVAKKLGCSWNKAHYHLTQLVDEGKVTGVNGVYTSTSDFIKMTVRSKKPDYIVSMESELKQLEERCEALRSALDIFKEFGAE